MTSMMLKEAVSAAECVALQLASDTERYAELGRKLRSTSFSTALTIARGSSDHAANPGTDSRWKRCCVWRWKNAPAV